MFCTAGLFSEQSVTFTEWPRQFEACDVALTFTESAHGGDKRHRSQNGNLSNPTYFCRTLCFEVKLGKFLFYHDQLLRYSGSGWHPQELQFFEVQGNAWNSWPLAKGSGDGVMVR